jgi:hypothetical protein
MKAVTVLLCLTMFQFALSAPLDYFKNTYEEADQNFNEIFAPIRAKNSLAEVYQFLYPHGNIKSYYIPSIGVQKNLLVMISGTHGVEGFAGSAVQRYILENGLSHQHAGILMIHGFNLWGVKNFRRVNENNIDLNRNFIIDRNQFKPDDSQYAMLNDFLNPSGQPSENLLSHGFFLMKAIYKIVRYSLEPLRGSILKGQYSFEKGLFYGGTGPQEQELLLMQLITKYFKPYKKIVLIDLHTGYGERSKLHLLAGKANEPNSIELKKIFNEDEIDFADKKNFYAVKGEMITFFSEKIFEATRADVVSVTFEYGTLDSQKTVGSIESLRRLVLENQNHHNPGSSDKTKINNLFLEMFYPSDPKWRQSILTQTDEKMKKIMNYLSH